MPDGVYVTGEDGRPSFVRAPQLTDDDVQQIVETTAKPVGHHATHISSQLWPFPARVSWYISYMGKGITDRDKAIIQQIILDRWNPLRLNKKIASHFDLTINQVRHITGKATFKLEYAKQLAIYQGSFDDIRLADRKELCGS